jgi:hypothetical protein
LRDISAEGGGGLAVTNCGDVTGDN